MAGALGRLACDHPPALEAVYAAKRQGLAASADLDRALRLALFSDSRNISMHHEIMEVAASVPGLDADALAELLERGEAKARSSTISRWLRGPGQGQPPFLLARRNRRAQSRRHAELGGRARRWLPSGIQ